MVASTVWPENKNWPSAPSASAESSSFLDTGSTVNISAVSEKPTPSSQNSMKRSVAVQWPHFSPISVACAIKLSPLFISDPSDIDPPPFLSTPPFLIKVVAKNTKSFDNCKSYDSTFSNCVEPIILPHQYKNEEPCASLKTPNIKSALTWALKYFRGYIPTFSSSLLRICYVDDFLKRKSKDSQSNETITTCSQRKPHSLTLRSRQIQPSSASSRRSISSLISAFMLLHAFFNQLPPTIFFVWPIFHFHLDIPLVLKHLSLSIHSFKIYPHHWKPRISFLSECFQSCQTSI